MEIKKALTRLKSKGTEVGREIIWIAKSGREEIKREERYRKRKQKLYEFSEKTGPEERRNSFNVKRIMRYLFTLNTLQLTT
jgi:hypothetical protein